MNIHLEGELDSDLLKEDMPIHIACRIEKCSRCDEGFSEWGYRGECGLPDKEPVKCSHCEGKGYILNLATAVRVKAEVVVSAYIETAKGSS